MPEQEPTEQPSAFSMAAEYGQLLGQQQASREAFADRLEPSPESDKFKEEMDAPEMIADDESGLNYAVYKVNQDKEGTPLVVNLAWSVPAGKGVGRTDVHEFATHIDRPIIVIDMEGTGETEVPGKEARKDMTFESLSQAHLRVIDKAIGPDQEFDVSGYSLGGIMAVGIAAEAGDRVKDVVTMASPGYDDITLVELGKAFVVQEGKIAKEYRANAQTERPTIYEQDKAAQADTSGTIGLKNVSTLLGLAKLMREDVAADAVAKLHPDTKWHDVVGSNDPVTDWTGHLAAVRARNAKYPRSSTEHILGSETHSMGYHRPAMAEIVSAQLR